MSSAQAQPVTMSYPGLYKTQLCYHGQHHAMPECAYAHSLSEVRPPDQRLCRCSHWHNCHFYVGQRWSHGVRDLFLWYIGCTAVEHFPPWALAALWFYKGAGIAWLPLAGYDFGISERLFVHDHGSIEQDWGFWAKIKDRQQSLASHHLLVTSISPYLCYPRPRHCGGGAKITQTTSSSIQNKEAETQIDSIPQQEKTTPCEVSSSCSIGIMDATTQTEFTDANERAMQFDEGETQYEPRVVFDLS